MWEVASGTPVLQFCTDGFRWAQSIDISKDGKYLAIGCGEQTEIGRYADCCVRLWRIGASKQAAVYPSKRPVSRVAFVSNQSRLVAVGKNGEIQLLEVPHS